jgi:parvulin-like peptidyl-prolyl isomerase
MTTAQKQAVPQAAGRQIAQKDLEGRLKLAGDWDGARAELEEEATLKEVASQQGLTVADAELQQAFDRFRASREMYKADDTRSWLQSTGLTIEQVEAALEGEILAEKVAGKVITDRQVDSYYNENPTEFQYARVSQIVTADKGAAEELALSARDDGQDFAKMARQHSKDASTRCGGGFFGLITREDAAGLPRELSDRIFAAKTGEVVGPFQVADAYYLLKVEEVGRRPLDDDLRVSLRQQLFGDWMEKRSGNGK